MRFHSLAHCNDPLHALDLPALLFFCATLVLLSASQGLRRNGEITAEDLSIDHKPDLPEERKRILAKGGTVSEGGAGRPSRVWAHGRIGLAMSRSLGDGECKGVGVIPDPEVLHSVSSPVAKEGGDGDLFVIVASDGVWEFIESVEACQLVHKHKNATEACSALVLEAAQRWKRFEGSYRDDITAIVAFLPFLEDQWPDEDEDEETPAEVDSSHVDSSHVFVNMGQQGSSSRPCTTPPLLSPSPRVIRSFAARRHDFALLLPCFLRWPPSGSPCSDVALHSRPSPHQASLSRLARRTIPRPWRSLPSTRRPPWPQSTVSETRPSRPAGYPCTTLMTRIGTTWARRTKGVITTAPAQPRPLPARRNGPDTP